MVSFPNPSPSEVQCRPASTNVFKSFFNFIDQDFSKFTNENFDATDWINDVFQNPEAQQNKELLIQEVARSLEDTSQQIVHFIPRLNREITVMQQEANLLKSKMISIERDVQKIEKDTCSTMDSLLHLDEAKSRLLEVEKALKEVDNWVTLVKNIDEIFQSGNAAAIFERLSNMQQSLEVFGTKVKDYQERSDFLERLKDQFVIAISPSIINCLTSQDLESAQYFYRMLLRLNRSNDFENYCVKVTKIEVSKQWDQCLQNDDLVNLDSLLNAFYDTLLSIWFDKIKWFTSLSKNPISLICRSILDSLRDLEPPINSILQNRLKSDDKKSSSAKKFDADDNCELKILIRCRNTTDNLIRSLESNVITSQTNPQDSSKLFVDLFVEFYRPYICFVDNYGHYETSYLLSRLNKINFNKTSQLSTLVERLCSSLDIVHSDCLAAFDHCTTFTHCFSLSQLIKAVETLYKNYIVLILRKVEEMTEIEEQQQCSETECWTRLSCCLKLAEFCGNFLLSFEKMRHSTITSVNNLNEKFSRQLADLVEEPTTELKHNAAEYFERALMKNDKLKVKIAEFLTNFRESPEIILQHTKENIDNSVQRISKLVFDLILEPARLIMSPVSKMPLWSSEKIGEALNDNLPSFSLAPQEYVTKIGQYLMTLAHHLEPYLSQENPCIKRFIKTLSSENLIVESPEQVVRCWLNYNSSSLCKLYMSAIFDLKDLSRSGAKQLWVDIDYLKNVLSDIGIDLDEDLSIFANVLSQMDKIESNNGKFCAKLFASFEDAKKMADK